MRLPGVAASTAVRDLLDAPLDAARQGEVVHVGRRRAGVRVGPRLLVVETVADDATLPCAVVAPDLDLLALGPVGATVVVGGGGLGAGGSWWPVRRWWAPSRVVGAADRPAVAVPATPAVLDDGTTRALRAGVRALLAGAAHTAVDALTAVLGRGRGSTPDADDAVAGALLAARATAGMPAAAVDEVGARVAAAAVERTTLLSAELLRHAATGRAAAAVVRAVQQPSAATWQRLTPLGASSGRATAEGIRLVHEAALDRPLPRRTGAAA
jgi:hypothetical protein